jgi:hypothetical protein
MAITNTIGNQFNEEFSKGEHDLTSDSLKAILLDTSFTGFVAATHLTYSDISANEIATGYGYTQKTKELSTVTLDQAAGVMTLNADNLTWTADSGNIEAASACAIINDTHGNDTVICCIEFGANYQATDGTALSIDLSNGVIELTANP